MTGEGGARTVGVVLVGGRSSRMGADKAGLRLDDGRTFLEATAATLAAICDEVITAGGPPRGDWPHLDDAGPDLGPLAGIAAALDSQRGERYLVVTCDAPLALADDYAPLVAAQREPGIRAAAFVVNGRVCPLPCVLDARLGALAAARLTDDDRSVAAFLSLASVRQVGTTDDVARRIRGVNTTAELEALRGTSAPKR